MTSTVSPAHRHVAQDAEIGNGQHRDFRVGDCLQCGQRAFAQGRALPAGTGIGALQELHLRQQVPRCSVWRPLRPPDCIQPSCGRASVARDRMSSTHASKCRAATPGPATTPVSRRQTLRTVRRCMATARRSPPARADGFPRCRRRVGSAIHPHGAGDKRFLSPALAAMAANVPSRDPVATRARTDRRNQHQQQPRHAEGKVAVRAARRSGSCAMRARRADRQAGLRCAGQRARRRRTASAPGRSGQRDVCERQFLLERRRMAGPLRQAMPEDQRIVRPREQLQDKRASPRWRWTW